MKKSKVVEAGELIDVKRVRELMAELIKVLNVENSCFSISAFSNNTRMEMLKAGFTVKTSGNQYHDSFVNTIALIDDDKTGNQVTIFTKDERR